MKNIKVYQVDVFTKEKEKNKGNPAAIIKNSDDLTTNQMQQIAYDINFNETVFICNSEVANIKLRYFTPGYEADLCGHGTIGAIFSIFSKSKTNRSLLIETNAGILNVKYLANTQEVKMEQANPQFKLFNGDKEKLCKSIGIDVKDIDTDTDTDYAKTTEDPVTGTASGAMVAYLLNYMYKDEDEIKLEIHQGKHMNKNGKVSTIVKRDGRGNHKVEIKGSACISKSWEIQL